MKGKSVELVTCQIIQYKLRKLSNYKARFKVRSHEMSMCTRGAGKRVNSYSTWYKNKGNTNHCVAMLKKNWFSFSLSETYKRPCGESCCFSATRD